MKILFVDDVQDSVEDAIEVIDDGLENPSIDFVVFDDAEERLLKTQPDVVVLDLYQGAPPENPEGLKIRDFIWENCFCPVVVYSAAPDPEILQNEHPLIKIVKKGSTSPEKVLRAVEGLKPVVDTLRQAKRKAKEEVDKVFRLVLRDVGEQAFKTFTDSEGLSDFIMRSGRRQLAAMMDTPSSGKLAGWEQYLCPPVPGDVLLADVLRVANADSDDPESFRLVLTPSCDMVRAGGRKPKVNKVLVARCCSMPDAQKRVGLGDYKKTDKIIAEMLSQGYVQAIIPLPKLEGFIPAMAANLRSLDLIDIHEIGTGGESKYRRVASCDSPFRELVSWAYMQSAARPGLPERDLNTWAEEIIATHG